MKSFFLTIYLTFFLTIPTLVLADAEIIQELEKAIYENAKQMKNENDRRNYGYHS